MRRGSIFLNQEGVSIGLPIERIIQVTGNLRTYENMKDQINLNVGTIIENRETIEKAGG